MGWANRRKSPDAYDFGAGSRHFFFVYDELVSSPAYRVMSHAERTVWREMYRTFSVASGGNKHRIDDTGFQFTYGHCREEVSERAFYAARRRILALGFFRRAPHLEDMRSGSPNAYLPSYEWRNYEGTPEEQAKLKESELQKSKILKRARRRRANFCSELAKKRTGKNQNPTEQK